jgi:hypothetical protein
MAPSDLLHCPHFNQNAYRLSSASPESGSNYLGKKGKTLLTPDQARLIMNSIDVSDNSRRTRERWITLERLGRWESKPRLCSQAETRLGRATALR